MACFAVPAAEAIITSAAKKIIEHREKKIGDKDTLCLSEKMGWLNKMLWGGSALLAFEHMWHGEITPFFPFFTTASDPAETVKMLREMATSGTAMAILVTCVWLAGAAISTVIEKRGNTVPDSMKEGTAQ